jgi:beta-glucosidase
VPLFPFGHGLSYSTFRYTDLVCPGTISDNGDCHVQLTLTCDGPVAGAEVVQVYVRDVSCRLPRPTKELRAFQKIQLEPEGSERVEFVLDREAWKFWDDSTDAWVAEAGEFGIMIGSSSADIRLRASTTLTRDLTWR